MMDSDELLRSANGILIDTNLLIFWLAASADKEMLNLLGSQRGRKYSFQDFEVLNEMLTTGIKKDTPIITTPHIASETFSLAKNTFTNRYWNSFKLTYRNFMLNAKESCRDAKDIVVEETFMHLGLTDTALILLARRNVVVLTDDGDLYCELLRQKRAVVNFTHYRKFD